MIGKFHFSTFYTKLKATLQKPLQPTNGPQKCHENGIDVNGKFFEQNLQQIAHANTTINRFLSAFIDHVCPILIKEEINIIPAGLNETKKQCNNCRSF